MKNQTKVEQFILLGLNIDLDLQYIIFAIFLLLYMATLVGNGTIVIVVLTEPQLHGPMYFFLGNLSCLDIIQSTVTVPKMLQGFLIKYQSISFNGCMVQLFFFYFMGGTEGILLAIMAYDRFVAICNPLRYSLIMKKEICVLMVATAWSSSFSQALMHAVMTAHLPFCGPNQIEHFVCDIKPLLKLACGNIHLNLIMLTIGTTCFVMGPFIFILISYLYIISFLLLRVKSRRGWQKAFSTCGSHMTVVALLYVPVLFNSILPTMGTPSQRDVIITVLYSAFTPVLNPFIYTLRNQKVKMIMKKLLGKKRLW
ncbi:PREDICTED: olfactory receptor 12D3-like [Thamnophis sirtalis]|uniref:Olfactory receptor n=1 Tax=Thamnophis sirtalis TaxID=35019 RepID=A0A6I9WYU9_9SAUR|nr:PREDICTED: olfactory receptor 12D3-like [Thamnophis sirtalis]